MTPGVNNDRVLTVQTTIVIHYYHRCHACGTSRWRVPVAVAGAALWLLEAGAAAVQLLG